MSSHRPSSDVTVGDSVADVDRPGLREVVQSFHEIFEAIAAEAELDFVLHLVARHITRLLAIDRCSVYLRDARSGLFRGQVGETTQDADPSIKRLTCGGPADGFTREIVATRKPVLVLNAQTDPRPVHATMTAWNVKHILGVPMVNGGEVIGLLFLDDSQKAREFSASDMELAASFADLAGMGISQAIRANEQLERTATLERQQEMARRSTFLDERLTGLALEAAGLQEIARAISQLTEKACAIHDARLQRVGFAAGVAQDTPAARILDPEQRRIPEVAQALRELKPRRPTMIGPFPRAGVAQRALVTRVTAGTEDLGYVVLAETRSRFTTLDNAVSRRSAMIVAFELHAQQRSAEANRLGREMLVRDLLRGAEDASTLSRRAAIFEVEFDTPGVVVLLRARSVEHRSGATVPLSVAEIHGAADTAAIRAVVGATAVDDGTVAVILALSGRVSEAAGYAQARRSVEALRKTLDRPDRPVLAALSGTCRDPAEYPQGLADAGHVMDRLWAEAGDDSPGAIGVAADLGVGRLFLSPEQQADVRRFAHDTLGPLLEPDERSVTLLETLRAYFAAAGNARAAAALLGVHSNTIRYRLISLRDVIGVDVTTDPDAQLAVHLAISMLDEQQID